MRKYGIDLDGVCFNFVKDFLKWLEDKTGLEMPEEKEVTSYYWNEIVDGLDKTTFWKEFHKFGDDNKGYLHLEEIEGAKDALYTLLNADNEIVYITNRPTYAKDQTIESLARHNFPHAELLFAEGKKHPIVNELGVDVFIDDSPDTIRQLVEYTDALIYCYDQPFNRKLDSSKLEFIRVNNWTDFLNSEGLCQSV